MVYENRIKTAIIPAAGNGTRLYPITKTQPKEMLPIYDKPIIQLVVEEAIDSGIETIIIITSKNKPSMENHFDIIETENPALKSLNEKLKKVDIIFKRQNEQKGLGHAILCAKNLVHDKKFAVLLGDDFYIKNKIPALRQLIDQIGNSDGILSSEIRGKEDMLSKGMIVEKEGLILDLIEKPSSNEVTSKYAISGRYILPRTIFEKLEKLEPSKRGEIELTDGIRKCLISGDKIKHSIIDGTRLDVGTPEEYLKANIEYAKSKNLI
jgi:UTP--glucose-1-phosphate uridylyltransferase